VSRDIPYLGVEPQPGCAAAVVRFIVDNALPSHQLICCCLSDQSGLVGLGFSREGDVRASFVEGFRPRGTFSNSILSPAISGDDLLSAAGVKAVSLIKIDVEGAELEVLRSFRNTLVTLKPTITFEILPNILIGTGAVLDEGTIRERRRREAEISSFLSDIGYESYLLENRREIPAPLGPSPDLKVRNYVARFADR
jgi:FkbM family methyltransferase